MIVGVTGHRPDKLGGYYTPNAVYNAVMAGLDKALAELKPSCVITGMAIGVDQWMAELCHNRGIPYVAAIPHTGQEEIWPPQAKAKYNYLVSHANAAYVISPGPYTPQKMHIRNRWMVDSAQAVIAVWNGSQGGTAACVGYAQACAKPIHWVQLPPEIWKLAADTAPVKKPNPFLSKLPQNTAIEEVTELAKDLPNDGKVKVSPFVSLIKEKAEEKAQLMFKEMEKQNAAKAAYKKSVKEQMEASAQKDEEEKKFILMGQVTKYKKQKFEPKEESKEDGLKYHRVLDLDD